jgi:hypothetical protein
MTLEGKNLRFLIGNTCLAPCADHLSLSMIFLTKNLDESSMLMLSFAETKNQPENKT